MPNHALTRRLPGRSFEEVVARARAALAAEGFGVLTEIDVKATFEKRLGVVRRPYLILGACNPALANRALEADPSVGVLLPCNVDVYEDETGATVLQAVNPRALFEVVGNAAVRPVADEVAERLERAVLAV